MVASDRDIFYDLVGGNGFDEHMLILARGNDVDIALSHLDDGSIRVSAYLQRVNHSAVDERSEIIGSIDNIWALIDARILATTALGSIFKSAKLDDPEDHIIDLIRAIYEERIEEDPEI